MGPTKLASFLAKTFHDNRAEYLKSIPSDVSLVARQLAEKMAEEYRSEIDESAVLSVEEINKSLDFLATGNSMDDQKKRDMMEELIKKCSEDELEWIFNIILKNVETSLGTFSNKLLDWISSNAHTIWQQSHDFNDVLAGKISGKNEKESMKQFENEDQDEDEIGDEHLFKIWTPMLLSKQKRGDWYSNIKKYGGSKFFLQIKFDGENVLLHKKGNKYRWFSRNNNDFSKEYGDCSTEIGKLSSRIHSYFKKDCESAIFNCELMLWDKKTKKLCRHNDASSTSDSNVISFRHIKPDDNQQLTVVLFDILYLNGNPLFGAPLHQRLELLKLATLRKSTEENIFVAEHQLASTKPEIMEYFENAMKNNEEGIVVKRFDSQYFKGQRNISNGWFKLKPSASKDCDLDLALVAIYPRGGRYEKTLYRFAAKENGSDKYRMCIGISYGLSDAIREEIRLSCGQLLREAPAELLDRFGRTPYKIAPENGGYVDFERWQVVKINSNGVRNGKLVDPVMRELRMDKSIEECDTFEDFVDYSSKVLDCKLSDEQFEDLEEIDEKPIIDKRLTRKTMQQSACLPVKSKRMKKESKLSGIEVAVLQGTSEKLRKKCEEILLHFDAKVVKNITPNTKLIIATAPKPTYPKTAQAIKQDQCSIISSKWIERCDSEDELFPWNSDEILHNSVNNIIEM
uniref:DNA ligase IV n=1 Tax=Caenorhabditis angaria TaxID=860376 RepID=B6VBT5_9PELO|nr:hypothetical protein Csp3_JD02.006 [Caenorhabditis angaria]